MAASNLRVGLNGRVFAMRWPAIVHWLRRDLAIVGPRPLTPGEAHSLGAAAARRHAVRPGLVSPWWVQRRANVAYEPELAVDLAWVERHGARAAIGVLLRALVYALVPMAPATPPRTLSLLGLTVQNLSMREALDAIVTALARPVPRHVAFVNADCFNRAAGDAPYAAVLRRADLVLPDGIGVRLAGAVLGQPVRENVNGTDLFPRLCARLSGTPHSVFLLGGRPGVAEGVAAWMARHHPGVRVAGTQHGYFEAEDELDVVRRVRQSGATLLLVAFGAPRQEVWIHRHLVATGARVAIGVGGLFDFYSGRIRRAAPWMRELGLEWVWRLAQEPGRMWRRYLIGNLAFLLRVWRARGAAATPFAVINPGTSR